LAYQLVPIANGVIGVRIVVASNLVHPPPKTTTMKTTMMTKTTTTTTTMMMMTIRSQRSLVEDMVVVVEVVEKALIRTIRTEKAKAIVKEILVRLSSRISSRSGVREVEIY
jgi:hypothetical protein